MFLKLLLHNMSTMALSIAQLEYLCLFLYAICMIWRTWSSSILMYVALCRRRFTWIKRPKLCQWDTPQDITISPLAWRLVVMHVGPTISCDLHDATRYVIFFAFVYPFLEFLSEPALFSLVNCPQQRCSKGPSASISHTMKCTANTAFRDHFKGSLIKIAVYTIDGSLSVVL